MSHPQEEPGTGREGIDPRWTTMMPVQDAAVTVDGDVVPVPMAMLTAAVMAGTAVMIGGDAGVEMTRSAAMLVTGAVTTRMGSWSVP